MALDVGKTISQVREIEQFITVQEKEFKDKMRPYESLAEELRNHLLQFLLNTNQRNARTDFGTAYIADKDSFRVEDQQEFKRHVIGTEAWNMIVWAVNRTAAKEYEASEGVLPPGINKTTIKEVRVLAPERKPTKTKLAVVNKGMTPKEEEDELNLIDSQTNAVGFD